VFRAAEQAAEQYRAAAERQASKLVMAAAQPHNGGRRQ